MSFSFLLLSLPRISCVLSLAFLGAACVSIHENARTVSEGTPENKLELKSFRVVQEEAIQRVQWETQDELACDHFIVERRIGQASFQALAQVRGDAMAVTPRRHEFVDSTLIQGLAQYRLRQVDVDGLVHVGPITEVKQPQPLVATR